MLNNAIFKNAEYMADVDTMTVEGTATKTGILIFITLLAAAFAFVSGLQSAMIFAIGGSIIGFIIVIFTNFKPHLSATTAPIYAACEGLALGGISMVFEMQYPGIASQAVLLTGGTLLSMMIVYRLGLIKVTEKLKMGIAACMGGIMLAYLISFIGSFFGYRASLVYGSGMLGIGFSIFVVGIAAVCLLLDFDRIETFARQGAPKYMEWFGAMTLLVTLVWLYVEILRLLSKLRSRD